MAKTHYTPTELPEDATLGQIMMRKAACGAKNTFSAQLYLSTDWDHVDCKRCLNQKEAVEAHAAHRAMIANLNNSR